jgi:FMN phosphatase YigB (HAD superfamily)
MVGDDAWTDVYGGRSAGIRTVHVKRAAPAYRSRACATEADVTVSGIHEVFGAIARLTGSPELEHHAA